jgi:hypothetical protein
MASFYRGLVTAAQPRPAAHANPAGSTQLAGGASPGAGPGPFDLLALPHDLIDRIVAELGPRVLPHLLLAHRALMASAQRQPNLPAGRQLALHRLLMRRQRAEVMALFDTRWARQLLSGAPDLDLSHRQLTDTDVAIIAATMPRLQNLNLNGNPIAVLPAQLGQHSQLQGLSLAHTQVTHLPDFLLAPAGIALTHLRLSAPLSQSLSWQQQLPHSLQHLNLSDSMLTQLPASLQPLQQLQSLVLNDNLLTVLPAWLGELPALRSLRASGNRLTEVELASARGSAAALQTLVLSENMQLTRWPLASGAALLLRRLDIHQTAIPVPPAAQRPAQLEVLADAAAYVDPAMDIDP